MDLFSFAVFVGACIGLALVFGMVLWNKYWDSPYLARRVRWFFLGIAFVTVSVLVVAWPSADEFWFGLQVFGSLFMGIIAGGFFVEAFEPDRFWLNRELHRIAIRK